MSLSPEDAVLKKSKRRSLLPQFSQYTHRSALEEARDQSDESKNAKAAPAAIPMATKAARPRPVSMMPTRTPVLPTHVRSTSQDVSNTPKPATMAEAVLPGERTSIAHSRPSGHAAVHGSENVLDRAGSTKSMSTPRPLIPSRTTSVRQTASHLRTPGSRNGAVQTRERLFDAVASDLASSNAQDGTNCTNTTSNIPHAQNISTVTRAKSPPTLPVSAAARARGQSSNSMGPASPPKLAVPLRHRATTAGRTLEIKPPFNTYQQHQSPTKMSLPKPPIPSTRTSSTKATSMPVQSRSGSNLLDVSNDLTLSVEQLELLQLSMLHKTSVAGLDGFTASARRRLARKHNSLGREYELIRVGELHQQRIDNLNAIEAWCEDPNMLVENLQILSMVHSDLTGLLDTGSRLQVVLCEFDRWSQRGVSLSTTTSPCFVQPLSEDWRSAHASLTLKMRGIQRNLRLLSTTNISTCEANHEGHHSALFIVLSSCRVLVDGLLRELEMMLKVEKEILDLEISRINAAGERALASYDNVEIAPLRGY